MTDSCEARVYDEMLKREADLTALYEAIDNLGDTAEADDAQGEIDNYALEATTRTEFKVLISTGGPADWLTAWVERERDASSQYGEGSWVRVSDVEYHFADWFDHAGEVLSDDSPLVRYFDEMLEVQG